MKNLEKVFLVVGIILIAYAIFSRFYGAPSIAAIQFRSLSVLILANTALVLAVLARGAGK
ncbi:MAG: hypothetical protein Q8O13_09650 [Candidatus Omnitrophota bacterium]|nr:hypothetical protein [Candidatus Omnitrophota bacterium]